MEQKQLESEIKELIVKSLDLEDIKPGEIDSSAPLFGDGGPGLDSIDALELGMALKKKYKVAFKTDGGGNKEAFRSVETLAKFISENRK